jgi:hypothetical protein
MLNNLAPIIMISVLFSVVLNVVLNFNYLFFIVLASSILIPILAYLSLSLNGSSEYQIWWIFFVVVPAIISFVLSLVIVLVLRKFAQK